MLTNCSECSRAFARTGSGRLCPECQTHHEQEYDTVVDYLRHHNPANTLEIARDTDIDEARILEMLQSGALSHATEGTKFSYPCARCSAPIQLDRFCNKCAGNMGGALGQGLERREASTMSEFTRDRFRDSRGH